MTHQPRKFSEYITSISADFSKIYNQALQAEELGLDLIAGPGYRKALEYLIKDYASRSRPANEEEIRTQFLGQVIAEYIDDARIRSTSKRAAWLGNDETHYSRKWEGKDLEDLKVLIELTVRWIESVQLTKKYETEMSD